MKPAQLRRLREERQLSQDELVLRLGRRLPSRYCIRKQTIQRLETGETPLDRTDPIVLAAIAEELDVPVSAISEAAYEDLMSVADVLSRIRWSAKIPAQDVRGEAEVDLRDGSAAVSLRVSA